MEYDEEKLAGINVKLATIDEEEDFNAKTLQTLNETYKPQVIFIEYNGTWGMDTLKETELPKGWVIVQSLACLLYTSRCV